MKSRIVRISVLIASVMGLLVTSTPAEATWVKNVTLNGIAVLINCKDAVTGAPSNGLSDPMWTSGGTTTTEVPDVKTETKTGPKGEPQVNTIVLNGNLCYFGFAADCVKESVGKKKGFDTCTIAATGTVTGFCGMSSGTGTAVLRNTSNTILLKPDVVTDFKFSEIARRMVISGGNSTQNVHGEVTRNENMAASGSCTNKTSTTFLIQGDVVIKKVT